jgi:hypothetical protein
MPASRAFEEFFRRYAGLPVNERDTAAFARLAGETQAFQVIGPPLAGADSRPSQPGEVEATPA